MCSYLDRPRAVRVIGGGVALLCLLPIPAMHAEDLAIDLPLPNEHPLAPAVRYAEERCEYFRQNIRDYTCRLVKRERIGGVLQSYRYLDVKVRCEQVRDGEKVQPLAVYLRYLAPNTHKGRQVLYVAGERDGRMLVRKGGRTLSSLTLRIALGSQMALRESSYPITDIGFDRIVERLVQIAKQDIEHDPHAENTEVTYLRNAQIGERRCMHIKVEHPRKSPQLAFHQASLFIDNELRIPTRLVVRDWPSNGIGGEPPIIEEYTYVNPRLNLGLTDADFDESVFD